MEYDMHLGPIYIQPGTYFDLVHHLLINICLIKPQREIILKAYAAFVILHCPKISNTHLKFSHSVILHLTRKFAVT